MEEIQKKLEQLEEQNEKLRHKYAVVSGIRFVVFIGIVVGITGAVVGHLWWGWLVSVLLTAGFVCLLFYHNNVSRHQNHIQNLIEVEERYISRLEGKWNEFQETGAEFLEETDYVSSDLDVFGPNSLYQMICTAHTPMGKRRLAEVLHGDVESKDIIEQRQGAGKELAEKQDFFLDFEALALECRGIEQKEMDRKTEDFPVALQFLAIGYTVVFIVSIIGAALQWWSVGIVPVFFLIALALSWITAGYCQRKVSAFFEESGTMQNYLYMMEAVAGAEFHSSYLVELQNTITGKEKAMEGVRKLEHLLAAYNIKHNPIVHWILSGVCLYDFHLTAQIVAWGKKYHDSMLQGMKTLGEIEMLSSLAVLGRVRKTVYPVLIDSNSPEITMTQMCHPLLREETAVSNSISLKGQTIIITGSNMSGKTTFLRTIGLNLILAYAGAPVCAEKMQVSMMRIYTSMRITDDVNHGISTFYAEILRIKEMVEYRKQKRPMLCLIDEIFKGTNSADRIVGAEAVIRKLTGEDLITIVSTHDFELCKLAENYHFEEYYEEDEIRFDYRLKKGMCTTTNALQLLKMAGLTENDK